MIALRFQTWGRHQVSRAFPFLLGTTKQSREDGYIECKLSSMAESLAQPKWDIVVEIVPVGSKLAGLCLLCVILCGQ